jgi:DNA polymerase-1
VLVGADYNQIELRASAHISGDAELTAVYAEGRDLHAETAALVLDCDVSEVTKEQRTRAKPCNFGAIYGISARSLCATAWSGYQVEMTLTEAEQALASFFGRYQTLKRWMSSWSSSCKLRRRVPIGCGRVVEANWEAEHEIRFNVAVNLPIQGACADALMRAMVNVHRDLQAANIDGGLALSVHDELILEVPEADAAQASDILRNAMLRAFQETFPGAPTNGLIEVTVGKSWAGLK